MPARPPAHRSGTRSVATRRPGPGRKPAALAARIRIGPRACGGLVAYYPWLVLCGGDTPYHRGALSMAKLGRPATVLAVNGAGEGRRHLQIGLVLAAGNRPCPRGLVPWPGPSCLVFDSNVPRLHATCWLFNLLASSMLGACQSCAASRSPRPGPTYYAAGPWYGWVAAARVRWAFLGAINLVVRCGGATCSHGVLVAGRPAVHLL